MNSEIKLQITEAVKFLQSKNITAALWEKNDPSRLYINKINCEFYRYKTGNICRPDFEWNDKKYGGRSNRRTSIIAIDCESVKIFLDLKTGTWHSNHWDNGYPKITDLYAHLINKFNEDERFATAVYNVLKKLMRLLNICLNKAGNIRAEDIYAEDIKAEKQTRLLNICLNKAGNIRAEDIKAEK